MTLGSGLARIGLFGAVLAVTAFGLNTVINNGIRRVKTSDFGSFNRVMSGRVNAQIVISGSSRALAHYDPAIIERITGKTAYNLGLNGSHTDMQLALLKAYLRHNAKPDIVVQNLDTHSLEATGSDLYNPGLYIAYLQEDDLYRALGKINSDVWKWKWIPLYGYAVEDMNLTWVKGLQGFFGINPREEFFQGYNPRKRKWTGDFDRLRGMYPQGVRKEMNAEGEAALRDLIELCRERGIKVVLVYSPEYYEMQALTLNRREIFAKFEDIARKYQVPFWDYSKSPLAYEQRFFNNSQHMNVDGATEFSENLAPRIAALADSGATMLSKTGHASSGGKVQ
jgi:hypothetical protein